MHAVLVAVGGNTTTSDPMHFVVLYAAPLAAVDAAQDTVMFYLMIGVPILIIVAGAATYVFSGRALRPVEAIRARVASMSEKDLAERVPVPVARDEVGRLAETMNEMIARLEQAQNVQRRFVADASHELRSPLATIGAGLELLHDSDPGTVGALQGETQRLGRLVDDLLLLARADERGLQPRHDEVDLDEIAEAERGRPYDDGVRTEVHAEHVRVVGDRGQLVRVLRNLVDNARRHARSRVVVTLGREGDRAALDVADDGPGVPASDRIRIFERFVRLDDARARSDGGSGLGLAIVAEVVAAHNGRVWVEDAPGGGALFRVRLPAAELPVDEDFEPADLPANGVDRPEPAASGAQVASSPSGNGHPVLANGLRRPPRGRTACQRPTGTGARRPRSRCPAGRRPHRTDQRRRPPRPPHLFRTAPRHPHPRPTALRRAHGPERLHATRVERVDATCTRGERLRPTRARTGRVQAAPARAVARQRLISAERRRTRPRLDAGAPRRLAQRRRTPTERARAERRLRRPRRAPAQTPARPPQADPAAPAHACARDGRPVLRLGAAPTTHADVRPLLTDRRDHRRSSGRISRARPSGNRPPAGSRCCAPRTVRRSCGAGSRRRPPRRSPRPRSAHPTPPAGCRSSSPPRPRAA